MSWKKVFFFFLCHFSVRITLYFSLMSLTTLSLRSFFHFPAVAGEAGNERDAARSLLLVPEGRQPEYPAGETSGRDPLLPAQVLPEEQAARPEAWTSR